MEPGAVDTQGTDVKDVVDGDHNAATTMDSVPPTAVSNTTPNPPHATPNDNPTSGASEEAHTPHTTPSDGTPISSTPTPQTVEVAVSDQPTVTIVPTTTTQPIIKDAPAAAISTGKYTTANAGDFVADNYFPGEELTTTESGQECAEGDLQCAHAGEEDNNGVHEAGDDAPTGDPEIEDIVDNSGIEEDDVEVDDPTLSSPHPPKQQSVDSNGKDGDMVPTTVSTTSPKKEEHVSTNPPSLDDKSITASTSATNNNNNNSTTVSKKRVRTGVRAEKELRGAGNWRYFLTKQATPTVSTTSTINNGSSGGFSEWALDWLDIVVSRTPAGMLHSLCYYQPYQGNAYGAQTQPLIPPLHQILGSGGGDISSGYYVLAWMWDGLANMVSHVWRRTQFRMCYHIPREVVCQVSSRAVLKPLLGSGQPADADDHSLLQTLLTSSHASQAATTTTDTTTTPNEHITLWSQLADILPSGNQTNNNTPAASPVTNELATRLLDTFHRSIDVGGGKKRGPFHKFIAFDVLPFVDRNVLFQMAVGAVLASTNTTLRYNTSHIEDVASAVRYLLRGNPVVADSGVGTLHGLTSGATPLGGVFRLIDALTTTPAVEGNAVAADPMATNFSIFGSQPNISRLCATTKLFSNGTFLYATAPPASSQGSIDMEELLRPIFLLSYAASHTVLRMVLEGVAWVVGGIMWSVLWAPFGLLPTLQYVLLRYNYNCTPFRAPVFIGTSPPPSTADMMENSAVVGGEASMQQELHNSSTTSSNVTSTGLGGSSRLEVAWVDFLQPFLRPLKEGMGLGPLEVWTCNWELVHEGSTDHSVQESLEGYPVTSSLCIVVAVLAFTCCAVYFRYQKYFEAIITLRERGMSRLEEIAAYEREQQELAEECDVAAHTNNENQDIGHIEGSGSAPVGDQSPPAAQALPNVSFPRPSPSPQQQHLSPLAIRRVTLQSNGIPCPTPKRSSARTLTSNDSQQQLHPTAAIVDTPPPSQDRPPFDEKELCT